MRKFPLYILLLIIFYSCNSNSGGNETAEGTLKNYYDYWDQINRDELHLSKLAQEYYAAFGSNNEAVINTALEKFQTAQKRGLDLVLQKFPSGTIQFPFEQSGVDQIVTIKSIYISGFGYPWSTAERNSFYVTFEYNVKNKDIRYKSIRAEFYDVDGDLINACNVELKKSGKAEIYVKPEMEFKRFLQIKIMSSDI